MRLRSLASAAFCLLAQCQAADAQKSLGSSPFTQEFASFARQTLDDWHVAGVSIAVIDRNQVFAEGYGLASLPDVRATPDTLWYVGSTTKAQVSAALAQLIDSKNYSSLARGWRTPIVSLIRDDFVLQDTYATERATLEDAASHVTGVTGHDESVRYPPNSSQHIVRDTVRSLRHLPMHLDPHQEFHYSNIMYTVLGHVVETLTGKWLGDVLKELIWDPLGMDSSYFDLDQAKAAPHHLSTGYYWSDNKQKLVAMPLMPTDPMNASGATISTVLDFAKWIKCLLRMGEPFSKNVHKEFRKPRSVQNATPGSGTDVTLYSLGWFRTTIYGEVAYFHSGSVDTHGALIYWLPDHDYGVVLFTNYPNGLRQVLMWRLIEDKLRIPKEERYDIGAKMRENDEADKRQTANAVNILFPDRPDKPLPPSQRLSDLEGKYRHPAYGLLDLRQEPHPSNSDEKILVADHTDFEVPYQTQLHHVTGDYWAVYTVSSHRPPGPMAFNKGQFHIGTDGRAKSLAVDMFSRDEMVFEGTITYTRMA